MLVDDHATVRQGLRAVLEREDDLHVVGESASAAGVLAVVEQSRPDVVLLDLKLSASSDTEGLAVCAALTRRFPGIGVLVLTTLLDDRMVLAAIQHGARGYVVKDADTTELMRAVRAVGRGDSALDARSAAAMVRSLSPGADQGRPRLTEREVEVLRLLAQGCSNRVIGDRLYISETTVKFHVGNLMRKLDVSRRAEAVYAASKLGYI
ncbi:DNA-binding response regulator [Kineosporia sp. NBRC 101731]|nr:DNA-binding response regulator [Kineosporia sp. NBRC 101731]